MTASVTITVGAPCSGKTRWARSLPPEDNIVLSLDDFRSAMFGSRGDYWNRVVPVHGNEIRGLVWQCYAAALHTILRAGWPKHIVLCNTALDEKTSVRDFPILQKFGVVPRLRIYDVPLETLFERNFKRDPDDRLNAGYLERCHAMMHAEDAWWRSVDLQKDIVS